MAKLGPAGKVRRLLEFLLGLRDDRVLSALAERGFGAADRAKGWALLHALGMTQRVPARTSASNGALDSLDAWRKEWVRLVHVSLVHGFAEVDAKLFRRIDKAIQPSSEVVSVLLDRVKKLERSSDATTQAALAKLHARGFTAARREEARQLLQEFLRFKPPELPDPEIRRAAIREAETALWAFYVEWSQVARTVIKDVRLLELLGFRGGKLTDEEGEELGGGTAEPAVRANKPKVAKRRRKVRRVPTKPGKVPMNVPTASSP
ncbi:MAG TPA: hypothetical protein VIV60_21680 [Polyangiaceae bacterium]